VSTKKRRKKEKERKKERKKESISWVLFKFILDKGEVE
jgi:hypothetical protein